MIDQSPLGKAATYTDRYNPELLFPIPRSLARSKTGVPDPVPFRGVDYWNAFELSWLNVKGKPQVALAEIAIDCTSLNIVESKSLKLYLNSLNNTPYESMHDVQKVMARDLTRAVSGAVSVQLFPLSATYPLAIEPFQGTSLDILDMAVDTYTVEPNFLSTSSTLSQETVYSDLLKSNCLATGQPDWGSILIRYQGPSLNREGLLKYILSYRNHSGFAEHVCEQIYCDLLQRCRPELLTVYIRYTRRGGIDINPFRSNFEAPYPNTRQVRQ